MLGFFDLLRLELRSLFADRAILLTLFGGILFYSFLYPQPYLKQTPRELPVVLVNEDGSQLSRRLAFMADATPEVKLVDEVASLEEAQRRINAGEARGLLHIPRHFYRDIMLGRTVTLGYAGDSSYFLVYGSIVQGLASAGGTLAAQIKVSRLLAHGEPLPGASQGWSAVSLNLVPVFNPTMGYLNYVVPGVFVLILHQILLMGAALLGSTQNQITVRGGKGYWQLAPTGPLLLARTLVIAVPYFIPITYMLGFCFDAYGIAREASASEVLLFALPFELATLMLGILIGALCTRRDIPSQAILLSSMPLVFVAGFIWPIEMVPEPLVWLSYWLPSTAGMQGMLRLNQMGADFAQVQPLWWRLWGLTLLYGALSWWAMHWRKRSLPMTAMARGA